MVRSGVLAPAALLAAAALSVLGACSSREPTPDPSPSPSPVATTPPLATPSPSPSPATELEALLQPVRGFRFDPIPPALSRDLEQHLQRTFGGLDDVDIAVMRVATPDGGFVPVRLAAISYRLPPGVPFGQLAYEVGEEFLGSTPENSEGILGGNGVYMEEPRRGGESVAFFVAESVFVYAFGATTDAPTELVSRRLFEAACSRIECEESTPTG